MFRKEEKKELEVWEVEIRTDMWDEMDLHQLDVQRELIITKMAALHILGTHPTARDLGLALQRALDAVTSLIDYRSSADRKRPLI